MPEDSQFFRQRIFRHTGKTGSDRAREVLDKWSESILHFSKVSPCAKPKAAPRAVPRSSAAPAKV
jgi:glutamate synthase domain-containing protein 3